MKAIASAPASSGNLGPGFDAIALALELRCTVSAEPAERMTVEGPEGPNDLDGSDMVALAVMEAVGRPMRLSIDSRIPQARGLGSSSAVTAAAAAAAMRSVGDEVDDEGVFRIVSELEGHSDNAAAAVFGGLVATCDLSVRSLELHPSLIPVVAIPVEKLPTSAARAALPTTVPLEAASRSISRSVFLVEGLRTSDADVLRHARGDELHEAPRGSLSPITAQLMDVALGAGALHAAWSGAGPSTLAFVTAASEADVVAAMSGVLGRTGEVRSFVVAGDGLL